MGFQFGVYTRITKNTALRFGYTQFRATGKLEEDFDFFGNGDKVNVDAKYDLTMRGAQLALVNTF